MAAKWAERPGVVMIGIHVYRVDWLSVDEWIAANHPADAIGTTDSDNCTIAIQHRPGGHESRYQDTMIHEVLHAVWDMSNLHNMDMSKLDDPEEFIIGLVSPVLVGVFKDNPHLVKYMLSDGTVVRS